MDLEGKTLIITGAGRGIGATTAELCARNGANVVVADIQTEWGEKVVEGIQGNGGSALFHELDVTDEDSVAGMFETAADHFGAVNGIVNNAATIVVKKAADITAEEWHRVMSVNATGVFYGCKHAIKRFQSQGTGGAIVNIGSISAVVGLPEQAVYCASKGAVFQLSRQIAIDYASENIRCNTIGPGSVDGDFLRVYIESQENPEEAEKNILAAHPIGRLADPKEIAEGILFLISDRASFITGANLQADGGYSAI